MSQATKAAVRPAKEVIAHIQWNNVRTWKDPTYTPPDWAAAFSLVRQVLTEQPKTFQDMVESGLRIHSDNMQQTAPGSAEAKKAAATWREISSLNAKQRKARELEGAATIPSHHPFRSSKFLKSRVIPILESLDLVHRKAVRPVVGTVRFDRLLESEKGTGSPFQFFLSPPPLCHRGSPLRRRNLGADWNRICSGVFPGTIRKELDALKKEAEELRLQRRLDLKKDKRTEEQMWTWEGRHPELSTRKQRFHLNRRKQKNRDRLERRRLQRRLKWDKIREEAAVLMKQEEKVVAYRRKRSERIQGVLAKRQQEREARTARREARAPLRAARKAAKDARKAAARVKRQRLLEAPVEVVMETLKA